MRLPLSFTTVLLLAAASIGCGRSSGPDVGQVHGQITLDGQPLPHVNIVFSPDAAGGSASVGGTDANGNYRLLLSQKQTGALIGKYHVIIEPLSGSLGDEGKPKGAAPTSAIPQNYRQPGVLAAVVKPGRNQISFNLDSQAGKITR